MEIFDLRSDTVTKPTPAMRAAIGTAEVGDDVFGEDPTANKLQERVAALLEKEAALFVPTGTMGNQLALLAQTRPGDEVVVGEGAHVAFFESGAGAAWAGVQFATAGSGGLFDVEELRAAIKPPNYYYPRTSLVAVENTHNRAGGRVFPQKDAIAIATHARANGMKAHLDGARLWHAAVATGLSVAELARPFDSVTVCFSKGLGAPAGSVLAGSKDVVSAAHRFRKMLGAGMRQVGILAAGALYALDHHRDRLAEDHAAARALAEAIGAVNGARVVPPETNIVCFDTPGVPAERVIESAKKRGVLVSAIGRERVRAVTHLDLAPRMVPIAASALARAVEEALGA